MTGTPSTLSGLIRGPPPSRIVRNVPFGADRAENGEPAAPRTPQTGCARRGLVSALCLPRPAAHAKVSSSPIGDSVTTAQTGRYRYRSIGSAYFHEMRRVISTLTAADCPGFAPGRPRGYWAELAAGLHGRLGWIRPRCRCCESSQIVEGKRFPTGLGGRQRLLGRRASLGRASKTALHRGEVACPNRPRARDHEVSCPPVSTW
jgi:hypothetical protein